MPNAFTEERKGIVNVLSTKCGVSEAISVEELKKGGCSPKSFRGYCNMGYRSVSLCYF